MHSQKGLEDRDGVRGLSFPWCCPVLGGIRLPAWRLRGLGENIWDARPRNELGIGQGHPRAFNFVIVDFELALFISTPCS